MNKRTADQRIIDALKRIQRAQIELDEACCDISPVIGLVKEWRKVGKVSDSVKSMWHELNDAYDGKRGKWELDTL